MFAGRRFQFRPVLTLFMLAALAVLFSLGSWQMQRLAWKKDLIEKIEARVKAPPMLFDEAVRHAEAGEDMEYTPVKLAGVWREGQEAKVFGSYEAEAGVYYFAPLARDSSEIVFVNLGYVPQKILQTDQFRAGYTPADGASVEGLFRTAEKMAPPASWFKSAEQSVDGLWFVRDPVRFGLSAGLETKPYYIDRFARGETEWPRGGTTRLDFRNKHFEYALTWFGLAAALIGVWLAFSLPKR